VAETSGRWVLATIVNAYHRTAAKIEMQDPSKKSSKTSGGGPGAPLEQIMTGNQGSSERMLSKSRKQPAVGYAIAMRRANSGIVAAAIISCIVNLLTFSGPLYVIQIYDRVLSGRSAETLFGLLVIIIALHAFSNVVQLLGRRALSAISNRLEADLEPLAFSVYGAATQAADTEPKVDAIKALDEVRGFVVSRSGLSVLFDAPWAIIYILFLGLFHVSMGILALICSLAAAAISWRIAILQTDMTAIASGGVRRKLLSPGDFNNGLVAAKGMTEVLKARWLLLRQRNRSSMWTSEGAIRAYQTAGNFVTACSASGMMALAAYLTIRGSTTAGVIMASGVLLRPTLRIAQGLPGAILSQRRCRRAKQALKHWLKKRQTPSRNVTGRGELNRLVVKDLGVHGSLEANSRTLQEVSFSITGGTVLCIRGDSGAGKSALCKALAGVVPLDGGSILLNGIPIGLINSPLKSKCVGYLSENAELVKASIAENISSTKSLTSYDEVRSAAKRFHADEQILALANGYDTIIDDATPNIPRGLRQRIALAGAFFADPLVLILDHPMAYCDERCRLAITEEVRRLRAKSGLITIVAYTTEEAGLADTFLTLEHGRIVQSQPNAIEAVSLPAPKIAIVKDGIGAI
jgi:ABC-type protease/lipase transport system fused ATPase/permease subunit